MKNLILSSALGGVALLLSACGDTDADTAADDTTVVETDTADTAATTAAADPNWPAGTRIVEEDGVTYGVDVDLGTNQSGNLDLDISTDGTDASNDRGGDR